MSTFPRAPARPSRPGAPNASLPNPSPRIEALAAPVRSHQASNPDLTNSRRGGSPGASRNGFRTRPSTGAVSPRASLQQTRLRLKAELQQVLGPSFARLPTDAVERLIDWKQRGSNGGAGYPSSSPRPAAAVASASSEGNLLAGVSQPAPGSPTARQNGEQGAASPRKPGGSVKARRPVGPTFDLNVRTLAGAVLATLPAATLSVTRGEIISKLIQVAPLPPTHIYDIIVGEARLRGATTLADRGLTCEEGGTVDLTAILTENSLYQVYLDTREAVTSLTKDLQELKCFKNPPELALSTLLTAFAACGMEAKNWQNISGRIGEPFKSAVAALQPEVAPHRTVQILKDYCTDPASSPENVARVSMAAQRICQWLHALYNFSLSVC